jgi:hypothetical protein
VNYYFRNRDSIRAKASERYKNNPGPDKARVRAWCKANPDKRRSIERASVSRRRSANPSVKLAALARTRIYQALKGAARSASLKDLIGCSVDDLKLHLQSKFREGMAWNNYGPVWHVDHIKPCDSFDLTNPDEQRKCFNFTNLQPLFAFDNISKGNRTNHYVLSL